VHISDDTLGIPRSAYDSARTEKDARAALASAVKRALGRETLVLVDAMNYIKGFRYQLYCEAKAVGTGCCVVSCFFFPSFLPFFSYSSSASFFFIYLPPFSF
jgi:tRNA uridine 5-carbamoylmethylation protein Kti12